MTGFIVLDKPKDKTSFVGAAIVRNVTGQKKVGHTGTLDPMATGVLPIAFGGNTPRFIDFLPDHNKAYIATFKLGMVTDTLDIMGTTLEKNPVNVTKNEVEKALTCFNGEIEQLPPMFSAIKINGKRLYELARQGIQVEREKRKVTIFKCVLTSSNAFDNEYTIEVECSKGTYIRSIIGEIGSMLGCGAVMTSLRRTKANGFTLAQAHTEEELKSTDDISKFVIPIDKALGAYPAVSVSENQAKRFRNGGLLDADRIHTPLFESIYRVYSPEEEFLGLGEYSKDGNCLLIKRVFIDD